MFCASLLFTANRKSSSRLYSELLCSKQRSHSPVSETSAFAKKENSVLQKTVDIGISMRDLLLGNAILTAKVANIFDTKSV